MAIVMIRALPWTILLLLLSECMGLASCSNASRVASRLERGRHFLEEGNLPKAQIEFRNALQIAPSNLEALLMNGRVNERLGNAREAASFYQSAIDIDPHYIPALSSLGRLYVLANLPDRAIALVKNELGLNPNDAGLLLVRAGVEAETDQMVAAQTDAERALALAPTDEDAAEVLAALYAKAGSQQRAIDVLRQAVTRNPNAIDSSRILAGLYEAVGQTALADEQFREIISKRPHELRNRYLLAMFYVRQHRWPDARTVLTDAIAANPRDIEPKVAYLEMLAENAAPDAQRSAIRDFLRDYPDNADLRLAIGALHQKRGELPEAVAVYQDTIRLFEAAPQALMARDRLAAIDIQEGRYQDAAALIAQVLKGSASDNDALLLRSELAMHRGDAAAAIVDLRAVLRDQPRAVPVQRALARALAANGDLAVAEESFRSAVDGAPKDTSLRLELATVLTREQRVDEAIKVLLQSITDFPAELTLREALVRAYLQKPDLELARRTAEEVKTLAPERALGSYLAGLVAKTQKRNQVARAEFEHAFALQPDASDVLTELVKLDVGNGRSREAQARVRAVVDAQPHNIVARNLLGELLISTQDYDGAIEVLTRATEVAPRWWLPYRNAARAEIALGRPADAVRIYQQGVEATDHEPDLVAGLGDLLEKEGRIDEAIREYETLYNANPRSPLAANNLAMLLVTYRNDGTSLDRARDLTASFVASDNPSLADTAGWVRLKRGEVSQALPLLQLAAQRAPQSAVIRYHLGVAELKSGDRDRARVDLQAALASSASFVGADEARSALAGLQSGKS